MSRLLGLTPPALPSAVALSFPLQVWPGASSPSNLVSHGPPAHVPGSTSWFIIFVLVIFSLWERRMFQGCQHGVKIFWRILSTVLPGLFTACL